MSSRDPAVANFNISPTLLGKPTAPTAAAGTNTTQLATTAFSNQAGGLVFITTATASNTSSILNIVGCFSSTYDNYRIVMTNVSTPVPNSIYFRALNGSTAATGVNYSYSNYGLSTRASSISASNYDQTKGYLGFDCYNAESNVGSFDIYHPFLVKRTFLYGNTQGLNSGFNGFNFRTAGAMYDAGVSIDGIQFLTDSANLTASISIYGYKKA